MNIDELIKQLEDLSLKVGGQTRVKIEVNGIEKYLECVEINECCLLGTLVVMIN